jgi:hypothetical protein
MCGSSPPSNVISQLFVERVSHWRSLRLVSVRLESFSMEQLAVVGLSSQVEKLADDATPETCCQWLRHAGGERFWLVLHLMRGSLYVNGGHQMPRALLASDTETDYNRQRITDTSAWGEDVAESLVSAILNHQAGIHEVNAHLVNRSEADRRMSVQDSSLLSNSLRDMLTPLLQDGSVQIEMKATVLTEWVPPQEGNTDRNDLSKAATQAFKLQATWCYHTDQWSSRLSKLHTLLVVCQHPPTLALLLAPGKDLPQGNAQPREAKGRHARDMTAEILIDHVERHNTYPTLTSAHFERWLLKTTRTFGYSIVCIIPMHDLG